MNSLGSLGSALKVKVITAESSLKLQKQINDYFKQNRSMIHDIKFSTSLTSSGPTVLTTYDAMIIYS